MEKLSEFTIFNGHIKKIYFAVNILILIQYCYCPYFYVYTWSNLENVYFLLILRRLTF
jgi:hypothetical protein